MPPYHFLFIMTDQHRAGYLSCCGNPILSTPNLDRIAESGVRFVHLHTWLNTEPVY
jgi:arylsulfatase A-like enzyme